MGCLLAVLALFMPRLVIVLVVIFSDWLGAAYQTVLWPLLGFFFMPLTTLAYAAAWHMGGGSISGLGIVIIVIAVLIDLGLIGGSATARQRVVVVDRKRR